MFLFFLKIDKQLWQFSSEVLWVIITIVALLFFIEIFAPNLWSSMACINLLLKIFSVISLLPFALHIKTINCGWQSVGNPPYSLVLIWLIFLIFFGPLIWIWSLNNLIVAPFFFIKSNSVLINLGSKPFINNFPFV